MSVSEQGFVQVLSKLKFFKEIDINAVEQLAELAERIKAAKDTVLFRQGDPPGNCYVILEGEVRVFAKSEEELRATDSRLGTPRETCRIQDQDAKLSIVEGLEEEGEYDSMLANRKKSLLAAAIDAEHMESLAEDHAAKELNAAQERRSSALVNSLPLSIASVSRCASMSAIGDTSSSPNGRVRSASFSKSAPKPVIDEEFSPTSMRVRSAACPQPVSTPNLREVFPPTNGFVRQASTPGPISAGPEALIKVESKTKHLLIEPPRLRAERLPTMEGFSIYHKNSCLGWQVGAKRQGEMLGELALLQDQPRSASAKCQQDCDFLVIARKDFDMVLRNELARRETFKRKFLREHVPGMRDQPKPRLGRADATYFFRQGAFSKGHVFLTQDHRADDLVCVVAHGSVEICRAQENDERLADRSVSVAQACAGSSALSKIRAKPSPHKAVSRPGSASGKPHQALNRAATQAGFRDSVAAERDACRLCNLVTGSVFGSIPLQTTAEPFTVRVSSPTCEVFLIEKLDLQKLPRALLEEIQGYIMRTTTCRLRRLSEWRRRGPPPPEPPAAVAEITLKVSEAHMAKLVKPVVRYEKSSGVAGKPTAGSAVASAARPASATPLVRSSAAVQTKTRSTGKPARPHSAISSPMRHHSATALAASPDSAGNSPAARPRSATSSPARLHSAASYPARPHSAGSSRTPWRHERFSQ